MMIFEKMISGSGQNMVSGFLVSGFYDQIRVEREAFQNTKELFLTPKTHGDTAQNVPLTPEL